MPAMTALLRFLVVWLLLLAMPFQAYASATMMPCASQTHDSKSSMTMARAHDHDHAAMPAAMAHDGAVANQLHHDHHADHCATRHAKCDCAACCVGAVLASTSTLAVMPMLDKLSEPPALYADFLPAVDLALPERPPQSPRA